MIENKVKWEYQLLFTFIVLLSQTSLCYTQPTDTTFELLDKKLQSLSGNAPRELLYIQTSKDIYETGEDLWFKTYVMDAQTFTPSPLSRTLYLQVFNESNKQVVWEEKYEIQNGFASGHVYLEETLPEGNYILAAFTMHSFFFDSSELKSVRRIQVRKDMKSRNEYLVTNKKKIEEKVKIQFSTFPEGGNLISGMQNNMAFKAVNSDGLPQEVLGVLYEDSVPLTLLKSSHAGMGCLSFIPQTAKKYSIRLMEPAIDSVFQLPRVYPGGISMRLARRDKDFLTFVVTANPGDKEQAVYLQGQIRGIVYSSTVAALKNKLSIYIPLHDFPIQGIAEFTLFNESLLPVAERLVYVNPDRKLNIEVRLDEERYETRGKVKLKIKVTDENGIPVKANLGVSVYDNLYKNPAEPENILSHCYLHSQLKGRIYDPSYYFDLRNKDREESLDLLMLTQGWRRYTWSPVSLRGYEIAKQPVIFDGITGEVHATRKKKVIIGKHQLVEAFNPGMNNKTNLILSDSVGKFMVSATSLKLWEGGYIYLKPKLSEDYQPQITLNDPFRAIAETRKLKEINYPFEGLPNKLEKGEVNPYVIGRSTIKLAEVTVTGQGVKTQRDKYLGHLDSLAKYEFCTDYICNSGVLNCEIHLNAEDNTKPIEGKTYTQYVGFAWQNNGSYKFDYEARVTYHYPKITEEYLLKKYNLSLIKAYYKHEEFYKPSYDTVTNQDLVADFRNTLLWEPSVLTGKNGEATLSFFCSDINSRFIANFEAVSGEGLLGSKYIEFFVLRKRK